MTITQLDWVRPGQSPTRDHVNKIIDYLESFKVYNPKARGATGDGRHDDTTVLQAAIDATE